MRYVNINKFVVVAIALFLSVFSPEVLGQGENAPGSVRMPEVQDPGAGAPPPAPAPTGGEPQKNGGPKAVGEAAGQAVVPPGTEEFIYLNVQDQDIRDVVNQISKATGKNFILDDKVKGKITILSEKKMTKAEAYQAFLSALEVVGLTPVVGPAGIIKIVTLKEAKSSPIPTYVDSTPQTDSFVTRLIPLQNISALEMSSVIKELMSPEGAMFAYPATNTIVMTDSGTNIDRLMKIIKELDQEGPQQVLEIVPINYADATEIAQTVLSLFEIDQKGAAKKGAAARKGAAELEELADVSKIIADERTNSLIVLASKRAIAKVRDVIAKLDVPLQQGEGGNIHVHYLKYANAKEMAETLNSITSGAKASTTKDKDKKGGKKEDDTGSVVATLAEGVSIGADETTNALIITGTMKDYSLLVDELISKLDVPRRQVYLEAVVMELEVSKNFKGGATGYGGKATGSLIGFGGVNSSSFNPAQFFSTGGLFSTPGLLGGILARDTITINVPNTSGSGTTELTIPAFAAFLNFLQTQGQANIVSTPNILTLDNQEASIDVSKTIYAKKVTQSGTTGFQAIEPTPLEAGLSLKITPQITEGDSVRLQIHHKLSNFTSLPNPDTGAADTTKREIQTTVVAMDGQTVVLGGLMQDVGTDAKSKVPLLGDIPILGWLFSYRDKYYSKTNLLVFITPYVVREPSDFIEITRKKIEQRNDFIERNFGKRQQRAIRDTIAAHRADLLEFTPAKPASSTLQSSATPIGVTPPVITAPPVGREGVHAKPAEVPIPVKSTPKTANPPPGGSGIPDLSY